MRVIRTARLVGLPLRSEDLAEIRLFHQDPEVMYFLGGVRPEERSRRWLRDNLRHWQLHGFGMWAFHDPVDASLVGYCGLRRVELGPGAEIELGYGLVRKHWRKGLATEMAGAVLSVGFKERGMSNVIALVHHRNARSRRVAERVGFRFERNVTWKSTPAMLYRRVRR